MKNSIKFKKDMLIVVENNSLAVAKLSVEGKIVSLNESGKVIFWNTAPKDGVYCISGYLEEKERIVMLHPEEVSRISQISQLKKELRDYNFICEYSKIFCNEKENSTVKREALDYLLLRVEEIKKEIQGFAFSKGATQGILQMILTEVNESLNASVKTKLCLASRVNL